MFLELPQEVNVAQGKGVTEECGSGRRLRSTDTTDLLRPSCIPGEQFLLCVHTTWTEAKWFGAQVLPGLL